jgi:hypothetical protein
MSISCVCDYGIACDFYHETVQRARKHHCCSSCRGLIKPGERYRRIFGVWEGKHEIFKRCADCDFLIAEVGRTLMQSCGGRTCFYLNDLAESWYDLVADPEPEYAADVRRIVGMQHAICHTRGGAALWKLPEWAEILEGTTDA